MVSSQSGRQVLCDSKKLIDGGRGVRFQVSVENTPSPAFAIRYHGKIYAYLNRCGHQGVQLDWEEGSFFDMELEHIICATHGALYSPDTGVCLHGRCYGKGLIKVAIEETEGKIFLVEKKGLRANTR